MNTNSQNNPKRSLRIAFVFTSHRYKTIDKMRHGQDADTSLRGLNHMAGADYFIIPSKSMRAVTFIPRLLSYDFIIAQDNLLLGYFISLFSKICGLKTRWLYIAMNSSTLIKRHTTHHARLFLLKKFWSSYARIICLSTEQSDDFLKLGIPKTNLTFIPFAVDTDFYKSVDRQQEEDLILSVGRDAGRDYVTLFRVAEQVAYKFIVVASHKNIPPDMHVPPNVSVLYDRNLIEVRDLYKRAKLVVIVSKDALVPDGSDCSGQTVILDALAANKTVIATRRSWITDYFIPGQDLVMVEPNDPGALVQAIDGMWYDAEKRKKLAVSGHNKMTTRYSTKNLAKALIDLMNSFS